MQLVDRERCETCEAADPADVRLDGSPAGGVRLRDRVDDRGEAGSGERRAARSRPRQRGFWVSAGTTFSEATSSAAATGRLT